jgi:predicted nuclease of restriction endonuclease-like (RecB) superfamily
MAKTLTTAHTLSNSRDYHSLLTSLKQRIRNAQVHAALAVNRELVLLYWSIGRDILARQESEGWGAGVIEKLAHDLRSEFPDMSGLSTRNLKYMRAFAASWPDRLFVQQLAAQIPWFHNCTLLDKIKSPEARRWYVQQTIDNGWSRNVLVMQIERNLYRRQGRAVTNFRRALPPPHSDLAQQLLRDPYNFDFLSFSGKVREREVEQALIDHIQRFLLELGVGFAFVGRQYPLQISNQEFRIDLLFYHLQLRSYVVIEIKTGPFKPEYAGKMNFYLAAVDSLLKHRHDKPTIGLILCKSKDRVIAEYALRDVRKPMGVSAYRMSENLPATYKRSLPPADQLSASLSEDGVRKQKAIPPPPPRRTSPA